MVNVGQGSPIRTRAASAGPRATAAPSAAQGGGGRRERRKREVYQRIRDAAVELFQQRGYQDTTVEAIAERADVAKGTVFNYFQNKEALLAAIAEERVERLARELGPPATWRGTGEEKLRRLFLKLAEAAAVDRELSKVMFFENMRSLWLRSTDVRHLWLHSQEAPSVRELRALVRTVLLDAHTQGELRHDIDLDAVTRLLESAYFAALFHWFTDGAPARAFRRDLDLTLDIVFRGLSGGPARRHSA